jgi:hypothetical protein
MIKIVDINDLKEIPQGNTLSNHFSHSVLFPEKCEKCKCFYIFKKSIVGKYICSIHEGDEIYDFQKKYKRNGRN